VTHPDWRPPRSHRAEGTGSSASIEDEPFTEALRRNRERRAAFAKVEAVVWLIGAALACAFGYHLLSTF
jgi:anti-sigma factor RsiW